MDNKQVFAENLKRLMSAGKVSRRQLCQALDFKYSTVCAWLDGVKYPRIEKIEAIARYFNVKKSELIENKAEKTPVEITDEDLKFALFGDVDADDELLEDIKKIARIHLRLRNENDGI